MQQLTRFKALVAILGCVCTVTFAWSRDQGYEALSAQQKKWVDQSCPRLLGPTLWMDCVAREVRALGSPQPDLSQLNSADRDWILRSCPALLGPTLAYDCIEREVSAVRAGMPKMDGLSPADRAWVQESCPKLLGPALYSDCVRREAGSLSMRR